jgi:hypothetical protein
MPSGVVSAMRLSCGRIPAASRIFAGKAMSPRPDTERVAFIMPILQKCRKTANGISARPAIQRKVYGESSEALTQIP